MNLTQQIASRIRQARMLGNAGGPSDFQLRVTEKGAILINLRTHGAELLFDDDDEDRFQEKDSIAQ
ncbi:MAG TPA: hypothetical protein VJQ06_13745 [Rhizomicrobium sp.]|nr:hypothetical protein [Rhizomicrobium sp.]